MWECSYANEPADSKLLWLRFIRKIWIPVLGALSGALLLGGGYFLKQTVFASEKLYCAVGDTYIEYIPEEGYGISTVYLNEDVWDALVISDGFVADMEAQLSPKGIFVTREQIAAGVDASLEKDTRIVTTRVTTEDPALSVEIGLALQNAIIRYGEDYKDIDRAYVLSAADTAQRVVTDAWTARMCILGAVLGVLISIAGLLLYLILDDSVYVPETFEGRYHIPMLGTLHAKELAVNLSYLFKDCRNVAVVTVETDIPAEEIAGALREKLTEAAGNPVGSVGETALSLRAGGCPLESPEEAAGLREADGVILAVACGRHDGRRIGKTLDFLKKQDCRVKAGVLWDADEGLLKQYYGFGKTGKKR